MTHPSMGKNYDYQRLEFLGDSVIDMVVLEFLMQKNPKAKPGVLSKMKASGVNNRYFSLLNFELGIHKHLQYSNNELKKDLRNIIETKERMERIGEIDMKNFPDSGIKVLADQFESLIGAIYLDTGGNYKTCQQIIHKIMKSHLEKISDPNELEEHPHSKLVMWAQRQKLGSIKIQRYKIGNFSKDSCGQFLTRIFLDDDFIAEGQDSSKLRSSEIAAQNFFDKMRQRGVVDI